MFCCLICQLTPRIYPNLFFQAFTFFFMSKVILWGLRVLHFLFLLSNFNQWKTVCFAYSSTVMTMAILDTLDRLGLLEGVSPSLFVIKWWHYHTNANRQIQNDAPNNVLRFRIKFSMWRVSFMLSNILYVDYIFYASHKIIYWYFCLSSRTKLTVTESLKLWLTKQMMLMLFVTIPNTSIVWHMTPRATSVNMSISLLLIPAWLLDVTCESERFGWLDMSEMCSASHSLAGLFRKQKKIRGSLSVKKKAGIYRQESWYLNVRS